MAYPEKRIQLGTSLTTYHFRVQQVVPLWYHCDDKHITETNSLTLSNNVYLMFYAKEVYIGT